ncbi:hypothetical protein GGS21DRAFT_504380 [Xylaria nigripes]|nr:hypothetical protein GGS21DRAFT_504380 [Xylaria nigripes]
MVISVLLRTYPGWGSLCIHFFLLLSSPHFCRTEYTRMYVRTAMRYASPWTSWPGICDGMGRAALMWGPFF